MDRPSDRAAHSLTDSVHVDPVCQIPRLIVDPLVISGASLRPGPVPPVHPFPSVPDPTVRAALVPTDRRPTVDHPDLLTSSWDLLDPMGSVPTDPGSAPTDPWDLTVPCTDHHTSLTGTETFFF